MLAALLLGASLLPMQVAVEGDSELSSIVVVRLLAEGHRVVPSADDAMTTLSLERASGGDVIVIARGRRTASERVLSGTPALVELEVAQRALLLLDEVGGEADLDTDGLPGGVAVDVQGRGTPLELAALRDRVALDLLRRGITVVRDPRDGDRIACIGVADDGTSLLFERQLPCPAPEITSTRGRLTGQDDVGATIAKATSVGPPRDRRTRGHPFLGRRGANRAPPELLFDRGLRLGAALELRRGPFPVPSFGARGELALPLRPGLSVLLSGTLAASPWGFLDTELALGPEVALSLLPPWLTVRAGAQAAIGSAVFLVHAGRVGGVSAGVYGSLLFPVTLSWQVVPGFNVETGAALGVGMLPLGPSRALIFVGVSWDGSGNFGPARK